MVTANDVIKDLRAPEYDFLKTNEKLNDNIILLTLGGSKAYGTNIDTAEHTSDTDIRGIALNNPREILLKRDFEQVTDTTTDTVIYSFNKIIQLLSNTNPNTIEMLGCHPDQYIYLSFIGKDLINNSDMFLSKIAVHTFGGYANSQLRRLQNALARNNYPQSEKEKHIMGSIRNALYSLVTKYIPFKVENDERINNILASPEAENRINRLNNTMKNLAPTIKQMEQNGAKFNMYIDKSENPEMDSEIYCDVSFTHQPLRKCTGFFSETNCIVKDFDKLGKRNNKKDDIHLNKHAMHLVRLYLMAFDILEKGKIITYRKNDLDLLMSIRNGDYQKSDGTFRSEFFEMIEDFEKRLTYDAINTFLPDHPDYDKINDFVVDINRRIVLGTAKDMNLDDYIKQCYDKIIK